MPTPGRRTEERTLKVQRALSLPIFLLTAVTLGCASSRPPHTHVVDPGVLQSADAILEQLFPRSCRMVHKLHLRIRSMDAVLTGHLVLDRDHGYRAVALDELGGPVFAFASCPGRPVIQRTPARVREDLISRGPARDLELIFLRSGLPPLSAELADGLAQVRWHEGELVVVRDFDLTARRLVGCREWQGRRLLREIGYRYGDGSAGAALSAVTVDNRALHYTMEIELLESTASPASAEAYDHVEWCEARARDRP